jgi:hypothetical protein
VIEKFAYAFVDMILTVAKDAIAPGEFGVALLGLLVRQAKVIRDSKQVSFGHVDPIVAAAVGRALRAVVQNAQRSAVLSSITSTAHSLPRAGNLGRDEASFYHATEPKLQINTETAAA